MRRESHVRFCKGLIGATPWVYLPERGVFVDHATVHRWAIKIVPMLATVFRRRKRPVGKSWRMDETYIKVHGQWKYLASWEDSRIFGHSDRQATATAVISGTCRRAFLRNTDRPLLNSQSVNCRDTLSENRCQRRTPCLSESS